MIKKKIFRRNLNITIISNGLINKHKRTVRVSVLQGFEWVDIG